ncbi:hypothetical protein CFD26_106538 [Aspergillus turcosus]|uniref:Myb-like DNA-binding domain-containing protein n=1 Tax=Aspergillus turcosus TaxID=1245748 RepID=A0A421DAM0_9EURO|nr:hypothetical protein CFD26_106538 [Aspergillus turcosus]
MSTNPETNGEGLNADATFIIECLKNLNESKQVDIAKVATALNYSNVASAGNRFRALRKRYGFANLECKNSTPTKAGKAGPIDKSAKDGTAGDEDATSSGETVQSSPSKPARKPAAGRKGAKANSKPIPATGPVSTDGSASPSKKPAAKRGPRGKGKQAVAQKPAVMESVEIPVKKDNGDVKMEEGDAMKAEA